MFFILVNKCFNKNENRSCLSNLTFVKTMKEFKQNLAVCFVSNVWLDTIDFSKWVIVGGCILNALCRLPFLGTKQQDINLVYYRNDILDFKKSIDLVVNNLKKLASQDIRNQIKIKRIPGTPDYNVFLPCHTRLNFVWTNIGNSKYSFSHILHNFDMNICQVVFTGKTILLVSGIILL